MSDSAVEREIAATVMLGIVSRACSGIRNSAAIDHERPDTFRITRSDLQTIEALAHAGNGNCGVLMSRVVTDLRNAVVVASEDPGNGWRFDCVACKASGTAQTFKHTDQCPAALWDRYTAGWEAP
jgi:hypothetical protein